MPVETVFALLILMLTVLFFVLFLFLFFHLFVMLHTTQEAEGVKMYEFACVCMCVRACVRA